MGARTIWRDGAPPVESFGGGAHGHLAHECRVLTDDESSTNGDETVKIAFAACWWWAVGWWPRV